MLKTQTLLDARLSMSCFCDQGGNNIQCPSHPGPEKLDCGHLLTNLPVPIHPLCAPGCIA